MFSALGVNLCIAAYDHVRRGRQIANLLSLTRKLTPSTPPIHEILVYVN